MPITNVSRVKSIVKPITHFDGNEVVTIYQNDNIILGHELMPGYKIVSFNSFIKNLKIFANVESLAEANLPDIQIEDSSAQKIQKVLDIEWKSPRKQLNLYISNSTRVDIDQWGQPMAPTNIWQQVGSVSLLNPSGYPFRTYNIMDFFTDNLALELGDNSKIGIQVQDVGYGLLTLQDKVTVHGSYTEEFFLKSDDPPININLFGVGGNSSPTNNAIDNLTNNSNLINNLSILGNT